ncbi:MAG: hypothetical protein LCH32_00935 [Bacteroidetes bacterium]|nr:hypothetical protein [Bacteroidota bacterium]
MNNTSQNIKKRLMFVKGDDFYFLTYNIIAALTILGCVDEKKFKDYRKLAFLVDFVSDHHLISIVKRNRDHANLSMLDRELLTRSYSTGLLRQNQIIRLLFILESRGIVNLEKNRNGLIDVALKEDKKDVFDKSLFVTEYQNMTLLKSNVSRLSSLNLETMLNRLYDNYGIKRWIAF